MIPNHSKTSFRLETKPLLHTLERALLLSQKGKTNIINLKSLGGHQLEITSVSPEIGKVTENIEAKQIEGEEMRISFNGKNVIDALKVIDSEEVQILFTGAMSPLVITPTDHDQSLHLVLPIRTY